jgi:FMN reductase
VDHRQKKPLSVLWQWPEISDTRTSEAIRLVDELRNADGVILASPAYHGGISGLIKNALDYTEDLRTDERTYLSGRGVGCVVTAGGPQASVTTLSAFRSVIHSLRGWPTPLGVTICASGSIFDDKNYCTDEAIRTSIETMVNEVVWFARRLHD